MRRPDLYPLLSNTAASIDWARDNGLLAKNVKCPTCGNDMKLAKHGGDDHQIWECTRTVDKIRHHKRVSIRDGSIFSGTHITIRTAILLIYEWSRETSVSDCAYDFDLSKKCVVEWFSKMRRIVGKEVKELSQSRLLGSDTDIVEIDEAQIGRRKAHKGRKRKEVWVFGAVIRGTYHRQSFMKIVKNRKKETLQRVTERAINKNVKLLVSDSLASYEGLKDAGYNHKMVNHSKNYISPEDKEVHTQTIESYWKHLRSFLSKKGAYKRGYLVSYLREFIFRRNAPDCFECILSAIQRKFSV